MRLTMEKKFAASKATFPFGNSKRINPDLKTIKKGASEATEIISYNCFPSSYRKLVKYWVYDGWCGCSRPAAPLGGGMFVENS